jgi:putative flavoprotein involved in K+ transport
MRFPGRGDTFPTKEDLANYLEAYAEHFHLPVQTGVRVDRLAKEGDRFVAYAGNRRYESEQVVVAMADYQVPKVPPFARELDPAIVQMHSNVYRNPTQLREGNVLVVGAGNSAADIAIEVAKTHPTWMSGKEAGYIPFRIETVLARFVLVRLVRFVGHHVLSLGTPIGRKLRPKMLAKTTPLVRVKPRDLIAAGIERVPKVAGVREGKPLLADGRVLDVANVIWCTGYHPGFSWIELPVFGEKREPLHDRGITKVPGMYFVGLHFQYAMSSATLIGVGRDAERIVAAIQERVQERAGEAGSHTRLRTNQPKGAASVAIAS